MHNKKKTFSSKKMEFVLKEVCFKEYTSSTIVLHFVYRDTVPRQKEQRHGQVFGESGQVRSRGIVPVPVLSFENEEGQALCHQPPRASRRHHLLLLVSICLLAIWLVSFPDFMLSARQLNVKSSWIKYDSKILQKYVHSSLDAFLRRQFTALRGAAPAGSETIEVSTLSLSLSVTHAQSNPQSQSTHTLSL
jgi:hypothetical protein